MPPPSPPPSTSGTRTEVGRTLVAIGNFDGVHRGHCEVLGQAAREAQESGLEPVVLTFDPHPALALGREAPPLLTTVDRKIELIHRVSPSTRVVVHPFDEAFASSSPEGFVREILVGKLKAARVLVGLNFRFGKGRAGDLTTLAELGGEIGFVARATELVGDAKGPWSSTRVRAAIAAGDWADVGAVLGRPHAVSGTVIVGDRRGRTLGFPTANLGGVAEALPPHGVYAVLADRVDASGAHALARGVANIGVRPTVGAGLSVEVHLFDFDGDLYGQRLRVHIVSHLRAEQRFSGLDALKAQIAADASAAREALAACSPDPAAGGAWV